MTEDIMRLADAMADAYFTQGLERRIEDEAPENARAALQAAVERQQAEIDRLREEVLREVWDGINAMIKYGDLGGNGCDETAQNNGVILAANFVFGKIAAIDAELGEGGK